jgi:IS5 family transposase
MTAFRGKYILFFADKLYSLAMRFIKMPTNSMRKYYISEGQRTDMKVFSRLWESADWLNTQEELLADKGYDSYEERTLIRQAGKHPIIPRKKGAV